MSGPYAYAAMRECLRRSGEMTPDHPDYWAEVIRAIRNAGLTYAQIAAEVRTTRSSISRWLSRKDKPKDHVAAALCRLLVDSVGRSEWQGLGGK